MALMILTAAQAARVRGQSTPMAALDPIPLTGGTYLLGDEVLNDKAHAKHHALLSTLPKIDKETATKLLPVPIMPGMKR